LQVLRKKVLVIRFNAIGDLVLTTPVVKALSTNGYEVHYLVKTAFAELMENNPHVKKVWRFTDNLPEINSSLKQEDFDVVIDLHNNLRSKRVKSALSNVKSYTIKKDRVKLFMLTKLGINRVKERHIVYRFLDVLKPLGLAMGEPSPKTYIPDTIATHWPYPLPARFLAIVVGAAWATKEIPRDKILELISRSAFEHIVLIGGPADKDRAQQIEQQSKRDIQNLTGMLTITESAYVLQQAASVVSGDTGMMHIAASLGTPCVAVFGSTHKVLGYTPFYGKQKAQYHLVQNETLGCRPCTKQGENQCPKGHFKCMMDLEVDDIIEKVDSLN